MLCRADLYHSLLDVGSSLFGECTRCAVELNSLWNDIGGTLPCSEAKGLCPTLIGLPQLQLQAPIPK